MGHFERGAVLLAADELDGVDQLLGMRIVEQEREALDGFVGESAAAGLFPGEMLVKKIYLVTSASELLATHCAGGPAANDCNFGHACFLRTLFVPGDAQNTQEPLAVERRVTKRSGGTPPLGDGEDHQTKTSEEYSTECCGRQRRACFLVHNVHPPALQGV